MIEPMKIRCGDIVVGPDGHEWTVKSIGGKDKTVLHCERSIHRIMRSDQVRRPIPYTGFQDLGPGPHVGTDDGGELC